MPELPDIVIYLEALERRVLGQRLERVRLASPFLLRTATPPIRAVEGKTVRNLRRLGKRIGMGLENNLWLVLHLMIAGRLHWREPGAKLTRRNALAAFDFARGTLILTEAGSQKRAALHVAEGEEGLSALNPGGLEVLEADLDAFSKTLTSARHTLKRAQLPPVALTDHLSPEEIRRLYDATRATLGEWIARLRAELRGEFPEKVTAFREGMAVHGRFGKPCPRCGAKVQRIRYATNETNYCARCQTGGKLLADRALSRLLKEDWPRTLEELEWLGRGG